jgi:hypothetical protein
VADSVILRFYQAASSSPSAHWTLEVAVVCMIEDGGLSLAATGVDVELAFVWIANIRDRQQRSTRANACMFSSDWWGAHGT